MLVLVSYDVSTVNKAGCRRLRRVAKVCEDWGIRVQKSVFEINVDWSQWIQLKAKLESICDPTSDSLRYYNLVNNYAGKTEHFVAKPTIDPMEDVLLV